MPENNGSLVVMLMVIDWIGKVINKKINDASGPTGKSKASIFGVVEKCWSIKASGNHTQVLVKSLNIFSTPYLLVVHVGTNVTADRKTANICDKLRSGIDFSKSRGELTIHQKLSVSSEKIRHVKTKFYASAGSWAQQGRSQTPNNSSYKLNPD